MHASMLENAAHSLRIGLEDYERGNAENERLLSAVRNVYAGMLLIFKEKLARLSPPDGEEILVMSKIDLTPDGNGGIKMTARGKETVNLRQIEDRFREWGIKYDSRRVKNIQQVRNDVEHRFNSDGPDRISEAIANVLIVLRDFVENELQEDLL